MLSVLRRPVLIFVFGLASMSLSCDIDSILTLNFPSYHFAKVLTASGSPHLPLNGEQYGDDSFARNHFRTTG